jgi:hypothetical protein
MAQSPAPQSSRQRQADPERAALMARLEAATSNDEKWALAEAIDKLPRRAAF